MKDHVPIVHAEVQERFGAILVSDKDGRLLGMCREPYPRVHAIIGSGDGLDGGITAIPVVEVPRSVRLELLLRRYFLTPSADPADT